MIFCRCKKGCAGACECRKIGLKCLVLCLHCNGAAYKNIPDLVLDSDPEDQNDSDDKFDSSKGMLEEAEDSDRTYQSTNRQKPFV